jgi:hypothetical protein
VSAIDVALHDELVARLANPEALLSRGDLGALGWSRKSIDAICRAIPVVELPGLRKPHVQVRDYLELVERSKFRDNRVRPT